MKVSIKHTFGQNGFYCCDVIESSKYQHSNELVEAWRTNNRINLLIIDKISDAGMDCTLSIRGGRGVAGEFAHMHNLRFAQLEKRARDLSVGLVKFATKVHPSRKELHDALTASGDAVESFLVGVLEGEPKRRGFKKGIFTTLAYFIAHDSHHRGRILLTLKVSGNTLAKPTPHTIWGWDQL